jgi:hypothetical protein
MFPVSLSIWCHAIPDNAGNPRYRPNVGKRDMERVHQPFKKRQNVLSLFERLLTCFYI